MDDSRIVTLFLERDEEAIRQSQEKYGGYCRAISQRILSSEQDVQECVNDVWLAAWRSIPPNRPASLGLYLGKLTRRISVDRLRDACRLKRGGGEATLALEELEECLPSGADAERAVELAELTHAVDMFLAGLPKTQRDVFVCRYWFMASTEEIRQRFGFGESKVKSMLSRTRKKLLLYLEKEGLR